MIDYSQLQEQLGQCNLDEWKDIVPKKAAELILESRHGDMSRWLEALNSLPDVSASRIDLDNAWVTIGTEHDCSESDKTIIENNLRTLWPWRKGPYNLFGIKIDTEWRSDLKWDRIKNNIEPLNGRTVLDVGCGSGYHCWRMAANNARLVIGIDPTLVYVIQFHALQKYIGSPAVHVLPFSTDTLPFIEDRFDTVFSMGVLYHRRSPIDHISDLKRWLRDGGQLILETLVIDESEGQLLVPEKRYAKMRNVWFIPSCSILEIWLKRCGFRNIKCIDVTKTTINEQRATEWMHFESLADFLDPDNPDRTIEGLPAPKRAIFIANT